MRDFVWRDLIDGKKAQSELNYYKGLNCPHVVEEQMQTITELAKRLEVAQRALKLFSIIRIESPQRASLYDDMLRHPVIVLSRIRDISRKTLQDSKE